MVTTVNNATVIRIANEVADSMSSKIDADCVRAATHRLGELEAELKRLREDRPFITGWNDGYATGIEHAADEAMAENERRIALASIRIPAMASEIRDAILKLKPDHTKGKS